MDKDAFEEIEKLGEKSSTFSIISIVSTMYASEFSSSAGAFMGLPAALLPKFSGLLFAFATYFLIYLAVKLDFLKSGTRLEKSEKRLGELLELEPPNPATSAQLPDAFHEVLDAVQADLIKSQRDYRPSRRRFGHFVIRLPFLLWAFAAAYLYFSTYPAGR